MPDTVVQDWTQVAPKTNHNAGVQLDSLAVDWPQGVNCIRARLDCTPFSGSASARFDSPTKIIDWEMGWTFNGIDWIWIGGAELGSPSGTWGKSGNPYPAAELDFSTQTDIPTQYRARATPRQTLNFGVSFQELNRVPSIA